MDHVQRKIIGALLAFAFIMTLGSPGFCAEFPVKPINLIISFPPGGTSDLTGRAIANAARKFFGQPIIVENKPGGGGTVGLNLMLTKPPDGYTLGLMTSTAVTISYHMGKIDFNPVDDVTHIIRILGTVNGLVVRTEAKWKTIQDFIDDSRRNPKEVSIGTPGMGSGSHLTMEELAHSAGNVQWTHIPYKGGGEMYSALLGGHVDAVIDAAGWAPLVDAGKFRLLVTFGANRAASYSQVPTLKETGYDLVAYSAVEIVGPKGMPKPMVMKLHDAFRKGMDDPEFQGVLKKLHAYPFYLNSEEVENADRQESERIQKIVQKLGLQKK